MGRKRRRPALDFAIYLVIRLTVCLLQSLTIERCYRIARALARVAYRLDRRHRHVALENLRASFGPLYNDAQREQIVRGVYEHFFGILMEILQIPRKLHPETWRRYIQLRGHEPVLDRLLDGGPLVMVSGHFGNWEMAGYLFGVFGFPPNSVARVLDNPHLDQFLKRFRERTGQRMIAKKGGYDEMHAVLNSGGVLAFLADQDAGRSGTFVDFFGRPASTHKAIALLAIEYQAPIVVGYARRVGPGFRYEVGCDEVIDPSQLQGTADDVALLTQRYTQSLERVVRLAPEQYFWLHRRWKSEPRRHKPKVNATGPKMPGSTAVAQR